MCVCVFVCVFILSPNICAHRCCAHTHINTCIYIYIYVCVCVYICKYIYMYMCVDVYIYVCVYVYIYICIYIYNICVCRYDMGFIFMYIHTHINICVYIYICMCIHVHLPTYLSITQLSTPPSALGCCCGTAKALSTGRASRWGKKNSMSPGDLRLISG